MEEILDFGISGVFHNRINGRIPFKGHNTTSFLCDSVHNFLYIMSETFGFCHRYDLLFQRCQEGFVSEIRVGYNFQCHVYSHFGKILDWRVKIVVTNSTSVGEI